MSRVCGATNCVPAIGHVVVVAGASGSGKSTFVSSLKSSELPSSISNRLPAEATSWQWLKSSGHTSWLPRLGKWDKISGLILDYDMTHKNICEGGAFSDDPVLVVLKYAGVITVINLRPTVEQITSQLQKREAEAEKFQETRKRKLGWRSIYLAARLVSWSLPPRLVRKLQRTLKPVRRMTPWRVRNRSERLLRKLNFYHRPNRLDEIYYQWEKYLDRLADKGLVIDQVFVEPDPKAPSGDIASWRAVRFAKTQDQRELQIHCNDR